MSLEGSMDSVLSRLRRNDPTTWQELEAEFRPRLVALAQRRLGSFARHSTAESVYNSVLESLFRQNQAGRLQPTDSDELRGLLFRLTIIKCRKRVRFFLQQRRDVRQQVALGEIDPADDGSEEAVALNDLVATLRDRFAVPGNEHLTERNRRVMALLLKGYTAGEIATGRYARKDEELPEEDRLPPEYRVSLATAGRIRTHLAEELARLLQLDLEAIEDRDAPSE